MKKKSRILQDIVYVKVEVVIEKNQVRLEMVAFAAELI
jgi:hypothetical protein